MPRGYGSQPRLRPVNISQPQPANMLLRAREDDRRNENLLLGKRRVNVLEEESGRRQEVFDFTKMRDSLDRGKAYLPSLEKEEWGQYLGWMKSIGADDLIGFLPQDVTDMPDEDFDKLKERMYYGTDRIPREEAEYAKTLAKLKNEQRLNEIAAQGANSLTTAKELSRGRLAAANAKSGVSFKAADTAQIGKAVSELFKTAEWDGDTYIGDAVDREKALAVHARAEELYKQSNGAAGYAGAARRAAEEFGITFPQNQDTVSGVINKYLGRTETPAAPKLQQAHGDTQESPVAPNIEMERTGGKTPFTPDGSGYDYETAEKYGVVPDETGHWQSRVELSDKEAEDLGLPPTSGIILKGKNHKTFDKTSKAEKKAGFEIVKVDGRYYSVPKMTLKEKKEWQRKKREGRLAESVRRNPLVTITPRN